MVVIKLIATIESSNNEVSAVILERKLDMPYVIRLIEETWSTISPNIIVNCFRKAKFYKNNLFIMTEQNFTPPATELDFDFKNFVTIYENIECFGLIDDENIIEIINLRRN